MLKFPAKLLALVGRDRLRFLWPAPGLIKDAGDRADRLGVLLQAAVPLEELLLGVVVAGLATSRSGELRLFHHMYYS